VFLEIFEGKCCHLVFVVKGGKTLQDSQKNVGTIWRELYIMQRKVYQWVEGLHSGKTSVINEDCLGHPTMS